LLLKHLFHCICSHQSCSLLRTHLTYCRMQLLQSEGPSR
jgi:hypothetical protein